jgi:nitrate reductase assembly molybdenum cofactor insertion protein NarJ
LLGLLFACPHGNWREQVAALAAEVRDEPLENAARAALEEATESGYYTVFGPGGPGAPREVSHRQSDLTGQYLAEVLACYNAFAYSPPRDEPPDHIATEIDFVAYLTLKQAYAVARNHQAEAAVTSQAIRHFMEDHLVTTATPLTQILDASGSSYLCLAATALAVRACASHVQHVAPALELDKLYDPLLPICEPCDDCTELTD